MIINYIETLIRGRGDGEPLKYKIDHRMNGIPKDILEKIENVEGVESLSILSRYSFSIEVGKCFDEDLVIFNVKNIVIDYIDTTNRMG